MNWKKTLNPWRYARGLADQLESEKVVCKAFAEELKATRQLLNKERRICDDAARDNASLKAELATALNALRIADERESSKVAIANAMLNRDGAFQTNQPMSFNERLPNEAAFRGGSIDIPSLAPKSNVDATTPDKRRAKAKTADKRTATAPGGAELHLKPARQNNKAQEAAYAEAVQRKAK